MDNLNAPKRGYMTLVSQGGAPGGANRVVRWAGMVMVLVSVLAVAVKAAFALTYVGPVTVTANMGSFSPNPVGVNNAVTSGLSANYNPPSGVPEGDLSAQYNWSVSQVQYKALQADTYGSPPADSYTDSISPTQPSTSSGATLTFTPLIAGYWAVSVSCAVTVTDTQTSQYWSGSGNAGPQDLTSVAVDLVVSVNGSQLSESQEEAGVTLGVEPQYQSYYPGQPTPVFTATAVSPADCTVTLNWDNDSDVLVQSSGSVTLSSGQQIPANQGPFSFYAYATPAFASGQVNFSVTAKPPTGGSVQDP